MSITRFRTNFFQSCLRGSTQVRFISTQDKNSLEDEQSVLQKKFGRRMTNFPDFIENWSVKSYYKFGVSATVMSSTYAYFQPSSIFSWFPLTAVCAYWYIGYRDLTQKSQAVRRNFPVLANLRYILETLRPEMRQYFIESENEAVPFSRAARSTVYRRAKKQNDTLPLGTRRNVYAEGYEWINHSIFPTKVTNDRVIVGEANPFCTQPYSASILNVSGMSYGALSSAAIRALSTGARLGQFYHNTGEGGISRYHNEGKGDLVWNIGTGYFGCRSQSGHFCAKKFKENACRENVKMIEIKLSQGAKPAHGGMLPGSKVNEAIAEARGIPIGKDCDSPPQHSAFKNADELAAFISQLRELSGGKPVGLKLCVGHPEELASLIHAMRKAGDLGTPDFMTIDGGEGGTGAAPPAFSNNVGTPLVEGLSLVHQMLVGAGLRPKIKLICSGKVLSSFSIVRNIALGADICNSARAMMFALGCIMALKCNTNK